MLRFWKDLTKSIYMPQLCPFWSSGPSLRSHLQYQRVKVYFGLNKNEACEKLTHITFFFFFNAGTTVFSISFLKLKTGKLIKETNSFILNMLYNSGLWDQEMKWKSHFCCQACSSLWWAFTIYSVLLGIFSLMWLYIQKLWPPVLDILYLDICKVFS